MTAYVSGRVSVEYRCTMASAVAPSWNARTTNSNRTWESPMQGTVGVFTQRGGFDLRTERHRLLQKCAWYLRQILAEILYHTIRETALLLSVPIRLRSRRSMRFAASPHPNPVGGSRRFPSLLPELVVTHKSSARDNRLKNPLPTLPRRTEGGKKGRSLRRFWVVGNYKLPEGEGTRRGERGRTSRVDR